MLHSDTRWNVLCSTARIAPAEVVRFECVACPRREARNAIFLRVTAEREAQRMHTMSGCGQLCRHSLSLFFTLSGCVFERRVNLPFLLLSSCFEGKAPPMFLSQMTFLYDCIIFEYMSLSLGTQ